MHQDKNFYLLALNRVNFLKSREKLYFLDILNNLALFFTLSKREIEAAIGRKILSNKLELAGYLKAAEADYEFLLKNPGIGFIYFWDQAYPACLREIFDPPFLLFYRGKLPTFLYPVVGIVGTRHPASKARTAAFKVAMELSDRGIAVISGLAMGIDAEVHAGSLAGKGVPIAVLGNGIDTVYPVSNQKLAYSILESGGVIFSEYAPGTPPLKYHFPKRNRIISGMARSVVIIQAPEGSGALITAEYALNQGRDIYVHKAGIIGIKGAGTLKLVNDGAILIENSKHILYDWGWINNGSHRQGTGRHMACNTLWLEPGARLANRLRLELEDKYTTYNGEFFRRCSDE